MVSDDLVICSDILCSEPVETLKFERIEVGSTATNELFIKNNSMWPIEYIGYELSPASEYVNIVGIPDRLSPNEVVSFSVSWNPPKGLREPLEVVLKATGRLQIG